MTNITTHIFLEDITFYAYHGVLPQEAKVGNTFTVNLRLKVDLMPAMRTNRLANTVNYAEVYNVLKEEMQTPSELLEHLCGRIAQRLFDDFPTIQEIELKLAKRNPPIGADIQATGIEIHCKRE